MKHILFFCFSIFIILISCNNKKRKTHNYLENKPKELLNKKDIRGSYTLQFENEDIINVVSNFFPKEQIDSFSQLNKNLRGKYFYCFKGGISSKIFEILKQNEKEININTAHSIIVKNDTMSFNGRQNLECLKENDSVLIKSTIFTFYQRNQKTNLMIIDNFIKIE